MIGESNMLPMIMMALNLAQQKQQQNAADTQRLTQSMNTPNFQQDAGNLLGGTNFGSQPQQLPQQTNMFETEEEKRRRLGF